MPGGGGIGLPDFDRGEGGGGIGFPVADWGGGAVRWPVDGFGGKSADDFPTGLLGCFDFFSGSAWALVSSFLGVAAGFLELTIGLSSPFSCSIPCSTLGGFVFLGGGFLELTDLETVLASEFFDSLSSTDPIV